MRTWPTTCAWDLRSSRTPELSFHCRNLGRLALPHPFLVASDLKTGIQPAGLDSGLRTASLPVNPGDTCALLTLILRHLALTVSRSGLKLV